MPDGTSTNGKSVRLLHITMSVLTAPALGEWHGKGLCIGEDPDLFFPVHGDTGERARQICSGCVVRDDCIRYATDADEFGIWGGLDQDERRSLLRHAGRVQ
jgi:WhiB family redox-sensing transcriptional regulator